MRKLWMIAGCAALTACNNTAQDTGDTQVSEPEISATAPMPVEPDGGIRDVPDGTPAPGEASVPEQFQADAPRPMLQNMTREEYANAIESGVGCSFQSGPKDGILLVATAPDDNRVNGKGVVKIGDVPTVCRSATKAMARWKAAARLRPMR